MTQREKRLATLGAGTLAVTLVYYVLLPMFLAPLRDRDATIASTRVIVEGLDDKEIGLLSAQRRLNESRDNSLPPNPVDAQREYQEWLTDLALLSNWREPKITLGSRTPRGAMTAIPITIEAHATLDDVNRFLRRLEATPLMQRVVHLQLDSPSFDGNPQLAVELTMEGIAVAGAAPRTRLFPTAELAEDVDADDTTLTVRNAGGFPKQSPFIIRLEHELVEVQSIADDTWDVVRGADGTSAAKHAESDTVELTPMRVGPVADQPHPLPIVHRLFVRAPDAGPLQITADLKSAVRGTEWTAELKVQNWDPQSGTPEYRLGSGTPAGMTLDARSGTLKWTPPADYAIGKLSVPVAVLGDGVDEPVIEQNLQIDVRRPNTAPQLETPETLDVWLGRPWEYTVTAIDSDLPNDKLTYSVAGEVPEGLQINGETGVVSWSPSAEANLGESQVEITVADSGDPSETDTRTLTMRLTDDNALYTYFVGTVIDKGKPEAWLYDRSTNQRTVVREGEEFRIADVTGKVVRIRENGLDVESGDQTYRLELGQNLRSWTPTSTEDVRVNGDPDGSSDRS
ncbi:MAG: cadherin repeat domain-containing protein [Planctomycetaceae bacterium]|nr:cadherin repeat domain-containing protein [Planctomycetaceae bacterium]